MKPFISIIIPVLNEEKTIGSLLVHLSALAGDKEIIVVDGGSSDRTFELAAAGADKVYSTSAGRAEQMNYGAQRAEGELLCFLHSDSRLEKGALLELKKEMQNREVVGGSFSLKIDSSSLLLRFIAWSSNLRARYLNLIFGDQGIFVRKKTFKAVGAFPEIELMEDWEFSRSLAEAGKTVQLKTAIYTSARRWEKDGVWKTIWLMHKLKILYLLGVEPARLKEIYDDVR